MLSDRLDIFIFALGHWNVVLDRVLCLVAGHYIFKVWSNGVAIPDIPGLVHNHHMVHILCVYIITKWMYFGHRWSTSHSC